MLPRRLLYPPEQRAIRGLERMSLGTIKGRMESAAPVPYRSGKSGPSAGNLMSALLRPCNGLTQLEQISLDTRNASQAMSTVLTSGVIYTIVVVGTYTIWDTASYDGSPETDAMFPSHTRANTQVAADPDVRFAALSGGSDAGPFPHHDDHFEIDLGSGFSHIEPDGGAFSTPQFGHAYTFVVAGAGSAPSFRINDTPLTDNYGDLQITLYEGDSLGGASDDYARCDHNHSHAALVGDTDTGSHPAAAVSIADTGSYFASTDVEGALQELGASVGGGTSLTIQEEDGTPSAAGVITLLVPNGSLTDNGGGSFTLAIPQLTIEELDGTPSGIPSALKFPNGTVTDNGDGTYTYTPAAYSSTPATEAVGDAGAVGSGAPSPGSHRHPMPGVFAASGSGHATGFVPDPGASAGTTKFLREDATWAVPAAGSSLTIREVDGTPSGTPGTLKFPNGSLTDNGDGSYTISFGSSTTVATDTIWDAKGDLAAGTGADTAAKVTVGADKTILLADSSQSTGLVWTLMSSCKVTRSTAKSLTSGNPTMIDWDTESWDNDTMHDTSSNTTRITIKTAGKYRLTTNDAAAANATGDRTVEIVKNGTTQVAFVKQRASNGGSTGVFCEAIEDCAVNDFFEVRCTQDSGGALNMPSTTASYFAAQRVLGV